MCRGKFRGFVEERLLKNLRYSRRTRTYFQNSCFSSTANQPPPPPTPSDTKNDESLTSPNDEPFSPDHTDCAPGVLGGGAGNQRLLLPVQDTSRTLRPLRSGAHLLLGIPTVQRGLGHQTVQMVSRWTQLLLKGRDGRFLTLSICRV